MGYSFEDLIPDPSQFFLWLACPEGFASSPPMVRYPGVVGFALLAGVPGRSPG